MASKVGHFLTLRINKKKAKPIEILLSFFSVSGIERACSEDGQQLAGCISASGSTRAIIEGGNCYCSNDLCNQGLKQGSSMIIFIFIVLLIVHN